MRATKLCAYTDFWPVLPQSDSSKTHMQRGEKMVHVTKHAPRLSPPPPLPPIVIQLLVANDMVALLL